MILQQTSSPNSCQQTTINSIQPQRPFGCWELDYWDFMLQLERLKTCHNNLKQIYEWRSPCSGTTSRSIQPWPLRLRGRNIPGAISIIKRGENGKLFKRLKKKKIPFYQDLWEFIVNKRPWRACIISPLPLGFFFLGRQGGKGELFFPFTWPIHRDRGTLE